MTTLSNLLDLPEEEKVARFDAMVKATFSHIDGRDLLGELHPRRTINIKRRVDGVETWFEGDWLSLVFYSRDGHRSYFSTGNKTVTTTLTPEAVAEVYQHQPDAIKAAQVEALKGMREWCLVGKNPVFSDYDAGQNNTLQSVIFELDRRIAAHRAGEEE